MRRPHSEWEGRGGGGGGTFGHVPPRPEAQSEGLSAGVVLKSGHAARRVRAILGRGVDFPSV